MRAFSLSILGATIFFWWVPASSIVAEVALTIFGILLGLTAVRYNLRWPWAAIIGLLFAPLQFHLFKSVILHRVPHNQTVSITLAIDRVHTFADGRVQVQGRRLAVEPRHATSPGPKGQRPGALIWPWQPVVQLNWYHARRKPQPGERWRFKVRLKPIHGRVDPDAFDYQRWAWSHHLLLRGYVYHQGAQRLGGAPSLSQYWRARVARIITATGSVAGFARVLTTGDKNGLSDELRSRLQRAGLGHLLALSGLHVGMVALLGAMSGWLLWLVGFGLSRAVLRSIRSPLRFRITRRDLALAMSLIFAIIFTVATGSSMSAIRATAMLLIFVVLTWARLRWTLTDILLFVAATIVLFDPVAILDIGFWLSYGAVASIALVLFQYPEQGWKLQLRITLVLWLLMLPVSPALFGNAVLGGAGANLLVLPLMSFLVMPALLIGVVGSAFFGQVFDPVLQLGYWGLHQVLSIADIAGLITIDYVASAAAVALALFSAILWLLPPALFPRWLLLPALGTIALSLTPTGRRPFEDPRGGELVVFDVGQGLSANWRSPGLSLLYDVGPGNRDFNAFSAAVAPYLNSHRQGDGTGVNMLIISHSDNDHAGGLNAEFPWQKIPFRLSGQRLAYGPSMQPCRRGQHWTKGALKISIMSPFGDEQNDNDHSCVVELNFAGHRILLPGDISASQEKRLLGTLRGPAFDVVVAAHHGSSRSSGRALVAVTRPRYALFSSGFLNRFKFPRANIVARFAAQGAKIRNTATDGAIICRWRSNGYFKGCSGMRNMAQHRWWLE